MKSTDLMIGDWIQYISFVSIESICNEDICSYRNNEGYVYTANISNLKPISLTPEILEKNGYKRRNNEGFLFCLDEERELYIDVLDGEIANYFRNISGDYEWHLIACCKYVHQLQHALRLCGVDKEIVI